MLEEVMKFNRLARMAGESMIEYMQRYELQQKRVETYNIQLNEEMSTLIMLANSRLGDEDIRNILRLPRAARATTPAWNDILQEVRRLYCQII